MRRFSAHLILTPDGLMPDAVVTVDDTGAVVEVRQVERLDSEAGVEFHSGIIVPGFVNAHCHFELSYLRRAIPAGGGFGAFARGIAENRGRFSAEERVAAADFWDAKMHSEGVAAVGDVCNDSSVFGIKERSPIAWHSFAELFGLGADPEAVFALRAEALGRGLVATTTPHSTYSLNREAFAAAVGGEDNRPLSIHFMESPAESELFQRRGHLWEWYGRMGQKPDFIDYGSPARRIVAQVPPDRPVMLIHNTLVTQRDIDTVMEHFTAPVTWVLCPASNRYISGLTPPVELLRRNGLRIAVGTDSLASNTSLSMTSELSYFEDVPLVETLGWATLSGAEALGMAGRLGSIEVGKSPGLVLLTGVDMATLAPTPAFTSQRLV
ncbi:MAG: amidohydrolase family protein [Rikenellaceae bacterium]|jgi:cytosine/adenosine deaminase-related metal-dependent hydrolase|nr:amidohydrolase family protein [Rikenellaceae bacterium]